MTVTIGAATIVGALRTSSTAATAAPSRTLALAALITWIIDAGSGGYMLRTWIARGGLRRQRAIDRLAPRVVFAHFGMASTGLLVWVSYLATRWIVLAWVAVGLLMLVIGLGVSTVTVWTPFPAHRSSTAGPAGAGAAGAGAAGAGAGGAGAAGAGAGGAGAAGGGAAGGGAAGAGATAGEPDGGVFGGPAEGELTVTDEMLSRALTDEALLSRLVEDVVARARSHPAKSARRARAHAATLIPAGHGVAAIATMILAVLTAAGATR
jgi:manganese efflux pump family protein